MFGEPSFLTGITDMDAVVSTLVDARPDAIQLSVGMAPLLQRRPGRDKPALVLRTDIANVYGAPLDPFLFSQHFPDAVDLAIRLDAVAVVANLLELPGRPDIRAECIRTITAIRRDAESVGMPLMVEPLVMQVGESQGYAVDGDVTKITTLVRQARELGADIIKADPTTTLDDYHRVIEVAGEIPVLVRGGGRVSDEELLKRTEALLAHGAAGIVYGRNIIQHRNPRAIVSALMAMLHHGTTAAEALELVREAG